MAASEYQVKYNGSIPWLIFWAVIYFPVAIMLFFTGAYFRSNETYYSLTYNGSRFWLGFWLLVFFPVALLLLIAYGCSWNVVDESDPNTIVIR
ncbi:MAG: hypothetical protein Q8K75_07375 [Chlamydiales bacterium]|nr:hypothetical protein [Chlamydiales bacterium]